MDVLSFWWNYWAAILFPCGLDVRYHMNLWGVALLELDNQPDHAPCAGP